MTDQAIPAAVTTPEDHEKHGLTPRQLLVAKLVARGMNRGEVAAEIQISKKTVDSHRQAVLKQLGIRNNSELTLHALRAGWITL